MQNKYATLKAQLLAIVTAAEDDFDATEEDDMCDASAEFAYVLEQIVAAYAAAEFDVQTIVEEAL
jgi:hypothetical protein